MPTATVIKQVGNAEALTNFVFTKMKSDSLEGYLMIKDSVYKAITLTDMTECAKTSPQSAIAFNGNQRLKLRLSLNSEVEYSIIDINTLPVAETVTFTVSKIKSSDLYLTHDYTPFIQEIKKHAVLNKGDKISVLVKDQYYDVTIVDLSHQTAKTSPETQYITSTPDGVELNQPLRLKSLSAEELGVGGLSGQFEEIFKNIFLSRLVPASYLEKMGLSHVKGVLMHGPPGCGKTRLARSLAKVINIPKENVKVINGPELLNKYVGQSEENVRKLFEPAEKNPSQLYVYIFDEFDSLARSRGRDQGVGDNVVNQLLTKIDGDNVLNNVIIIGSTNRPDLIDDAIKRPGRLEVSLYVGLPDEKGRLEILKIHSDAMLKNNIISLGLLEFLAKETEYFTGAELESLLKRLSLEVTRKKIDASSVTSMEKSMKILDKEIPTIHRDDAIEILKRMTPMFGRANSRGVVMESLKRFYEEVSKTGFRDVSGMLIFMFEFSDDWTTKEENKFKVFNYWHSHKTLISPTWKEFEYNHIYAKNVEELARSDLRKIVTGKTSLDPLDPSTPRTVVLHGTKSNGKTTFSALCLHFAGNRYSRYLCARDFLGRTEGEKIKILNDSFTSDVTGGLVVIDNLEQVLEYGPGRYNNVLYQTLMTLLNEKKHYCILITKRFEVIEHLNIIDEIDDSLDFDKYPFLPVM
jgi:AAA+ superfamily predicted ATPase